MSARRDSDAPVTLSDPLASLRRGGTIRLKLLKIGALAGSFAGSFGAFTVSGVPIDRDAFVSETSLSYAVTNAVSLGVSYSGQYGKRASDSAFKGSLEVSF